MRHPDGAAFQAEEGSRADPPSLAGYTAPYSPRKGEFRHPSVVNQLRAKKAGGSNQVYNRCRFGIREPLGMADNSAFIATALGKGWNPTGDNQPGVIDIE